MKLEGMGCVCAHRLGGLTRSDAGVYSAFSLTECLSVAFLCSAEPHGHVLPGSFAGDAQWGP